MITTNQLKEALNIQVDRDVLGKNNLLIGAILFELDLMSSEQIEVILNVMLKAMRTENQFWGERTHIIVVNEIGLQSTL